MASIAALMATDMVTAHPDETIREVATRMSANKVGAVLVIEDGILRGLFSERDLVSRVTGAGRNPDSTRVGFVATRDVISIDVNAPLKSVLQVFRERKFRHLPVTDGGKPVGILSTRDLLEALVLGFERYVDDLKYKRDLAEGEDPYDHIGGSYGR